MPEESGVSGGSRMTGGKNILVVDDEQMIRVDFIIIFCVYKCKRKNSCIDKVALVNSCKALYEYSLNTEEKGSVHDKGSIFCIVSAI